VLETSPKNWSPDGEARLAPRGDAAIRVLLAEDTPISAEMMLAMARHLSFEMDVAGNGLDAIEMVHQAIADRRPYSLMLVDVMMPILDGVETTRRLRAEGIGAEELPIIAVTAATDIDEVRSYRAAGMQAFLEKPVGLYDLRSALQAWGHSTHSREVIVKPRALEALQKQFDERKRATLARIERALALGSFEEELVMELRTMLHQIAGTAGSFGDGALSDAAREQEGALMAAFFGQGEVRDVLEQAVESLNKGI
jgi:CheY-like chemotaxis protein